MSGVFTKIRQMCRCCWLVEDDSRERLLPLVTYLLLVCFSSVSTIIIEGDVVFSSPFCVVDMCSVCQVQADYYLTAMPSSVQSLRLRAQQLVHG